MKLMITKKSSQETGLVRAIPATLLVIVNSRKRSFLQVNANGLRMRLTHHQGRFALKGIQGGREDITINIGEDGS